jgi:hypothetical protein
MSKISDFSLALREHGTADTMELSLSKHRIDSSDKRSYLTEFIGCEFRALVFVQFPNTLVRVSGNKKAMDFIQKYLNNRLPRGLRSFK